MHFFAHLLTRAILVACTLTAAMPAAGQSTAMPNASFNLIGHIEKFVIDGETNGAVNDFTRGGTMTIRGQAVTLPRNLLVTMPGRYLLPTELATSPIPGQMGSGLALADDPPPPVPFEAEVIGNIVKLEYIAAVVRISQGALHIGAGFIQHIDETTGLMTIGAPGLLNGAKVVLNDVKGIFGLPNSQRGVLAGKLDPRFQLDPDNSPVHARTGFPVCVPHGLISPGIHPCSNVPRPADIPRRFTCAGTGATLGQAASTDAPAKKCDPAQPFPLAVGDYVTYVGMLTKVKIDTEPEFIVAAHGLEAELGIYTSPGANPAYVFIEVALQGTKGEKFTDIPQEETTRFRIVGFTTDPSRGVQVRLIDTMRDDVGISLTGPAGLTPSNGLPLGRFRNTWGSKDNARAVRRDVFAQIVPAPRDTGPAIGSELPSGLKVGTYTAPISEYIYPEVTNFGVRGFPVPVPTENFCFLFRNGGTYTRMADDLKPVSQRIPVTLDRLTPFPASGHAESQTINPPAPLRVCDP